MTPIKLYGERVAVIPLSDDDIQKSGKIVLPGNRTKAYEIGKVMAIGTGTIIDNGVEKKKPIWVKEGDLVIYQLNALMSMNTFYRDQFYVLHQGDLIGRLDQAELSFKSFTILGEYVLLAPFSEISKPTTIIIPDTAATISDFRFVLAQKGSGTKLDAEIGEEVIVERTRCNPIMAGGVEGAFTHYGNVYGAMSR